jgi:5'-methylthioadenosine phosphorylase
MPPKSPLIGIIGGSGLGESLGGERGQKVTPDTPFGPPSSPITLATWQGVEIAILQRHGPGHIFNPSVVPYRANIFALKKIGVTHVIASGATGSLRDNIKPGQLVIADQVIDKTHKRAHTFYDHAAVHVEMSTPYCPVMRRWLIEAAENVPDITVHKKGTYICMEGPVFSTVAESHMHRAWGGDLIGMTSMPEAKLAREAELPYALIALPTDYDCWIPRKAELGQQALLKEIIGNLKMASAASVSLIKAALSDISILTSIESPAQTALELAIWSDKKLIPRAEVERLAPLWGRYF